MAGIPEQCPIWSISYCGPVNNDLAADTASLRVEMVRHNSRLLAESTPKGEGTDVQDMRRCIELNPNRCLRASISMQACANLAESLEWSVKE